MVVGCSAPLLRKKWSWGPLLLLFTGQPLSPAPWASSPLFLFGMSWCDSGVAYFSLMPESCVPLWWCGSLWVGLEGTFRVT